MSHKYFFVGLMVVLASLSFTLSSFGNREGYSALFNNQALLYEREVHIQGVSVDSVKEELKERLPWHKSNLFWVFNGSEVVRDLFRYPGVQEAKLERCGWFSLKCFLVSVKRVAPAFVVQFSKEKWLVSDQGTFISPESRSQHDLELPYIQGLYRLGNSPETTRAVFPAISKALRSLERGAGKTVSEVELERSGDATVRFSGVSFPMQVRLLGRNADELEQVGRRFEALYELKSDEASQVRSVDLRFTDMGVIKLATE